MLSIRSILFLFLCNVSLAQWVQVGSKLDDIGPFSAISVVDSNVVWVAGGYLGPIVYRTVNGGVNWISISTAGLTNTTVGSIAARDSLTAYVGGIPDPGFWGNAKLFKTTNAGLNWILIDSTGGHWGIFYDIVFSKSHPDFGVAFSNSPQGAGNPFCLFKTENNGINWTRLNPPGISDSYSYFYCGFVIDFSFFGFTINQPFNNNYPGRSYITGDGGNNWEKGKEFIKFGSASMAFSDDKSTGLIVYSSYLPYIRRTTNGGIDWDSINTFSDVTGDVTASWISGTNTVFMCCESSPSNNNVIRSDDGGLTWASQSTSSLEGLKEIDYFRYNNKAVAYCIATPDANTGFILKTKQSVSPVSVSQLESNIPENIILLQNYPNPFNPSTTISFSLPNSGFVKIRIYDVIGKEVTNLLNDKKEMGRYDVDFNASEYPSGVYFYSLEFNGFSQTKRMLLLK